VRFRQLGGIDPADALVRLTTGDASRGDRAKAGFSRPACGIE